MLDAPAQLSFIDALPVRGQKVASRAARSHDAAELCRDCGTEPRMEMWATCRSCWDANRRRDYLGNQSGMAA
jgi:hypothetical protein